MSLPTIPLNACVEHQSLVASNDLDHLIFESKPFDLPLPYQIALRERHVRDAVLHHLQCCREYAAFAEKCGLNPQSFQLEEIPVIPSTTFKERKILSVPEAQIAKWSLSSGTRGLQSQVGRDQTSLERLIASLRSGFEMMGTWHEDEVEVLHLGPDRAEAGEIWFLYIMSLIELIHPTQHYVRHEYFDVQAAIRRLLQLQKSEIRQIVIVGAPFRVLEMADALQKNQVNLLAEERLIVVTAGGWKRHAGIEVPREQFHQRVLQSFGLCSPSQIRDVFNQVELNTAFVECEAHRKHVPPWIFATTRDVDTLKVLPTGSEGLLSYLDASATSFPAFLVTDDIGRIDEGKCPCGREGVTMQIHRRLTRADARGCAIALDQNRYQKRPMENTE